MQNSLFLILIVRGNRDYFSEDQTQSLFNGNGNPDRKRADIAVTNSHKPKSAPSNRNDSYSDMNKGNNRSK